MRRARYARTISNAAANLINWSGGSVELTDDDTADRRYRIYLPDSAKWIARGQYDIGQGYVIHFFPSGAVRAW